jgi:hypothetical protein
MLKSTRVVTTAQVHSENGRLYRKAPQRDNTRRLLRDDGGDCAARRKSRSLPRVPRDDQEAGTVYGSAQRHGSSTRYLEDGARSSRLGLPSSSRPHRQHRSNDERSQNSLHPKPSHLHSQRAMVAPTNPLRTTLSRSMHSVTELRTAEVPVILDETTTKWINGVTSRTTCDDVIDAILLRQKRKGKVRVRKNK